MKETLPPDLRDHVVGREVPTEEEVDAFILEQIELLYPGGRICAVMREDREDQSAEAKAVALQDRARSYAESLIAAVPPTQRVMLAAPPPKKCIRQRANFDARHPQYIEQRHGPYRDVIRGFSTVAQKLGHAPAWGNTIRCELALIALTRGEAPIFPTCDGRKRQPNPDAELIGGAIFKPLWDAHERALIEAEQRAIVREFQASPSPLQSPKAALLRSFWEAATMAKTGRHPSNVRALITVFATVIDECRKEITS